MPNQPNQIGQYSNLSPDTQLGVGVRIGNHVTVYPRVAIGDAVTVYDGAVLGRPPQAAGITTRPLHDDGKTLQLGAGCVVGANAVLYRGIQVGQNSLIGDLASIREGCTIGQQSVIGRGVLVMYDTQIGARVRVIDGAILTGNMVIEDDVFIGPGVQSVNDNEVYLVRFGLKPFQVQGPIIRRFALIGTGANLAAGIEVGEGAIVAPSAMVTRNVPAWTVVAGVPAKPVRPVDPADRALILNHFGLKTQE
jgi:acetyltransferase-like isoleucine patch superfamily enzyme